MVVIVEEDPVAIKYVDSDNVITEIYNKIFNFKKGIHKLYNDDDITLDDFIKINGYSN